jgi:hypothetical protein
MGVLMVEKGVEEAAGSSDAGLLVEEPIAL